MTQNQDCQKMIGVFNVFFEQENNLIKAQSKIVDIIEYYSNSLNRDCSPILLELTASLFEYRKIKALDSASDQTCNPLICDLIKNVSEKANMCFESTETAVLYLEDKCRIVLNKIAMCQHDIKSIYLQYSNLLFHASSVLELKSIKASKNRLNAYRNEVLNSIFACSDFTAIAQFILRAVSGSMYVLHNNIVILPKNPILSRENGLLELANPVALYALDASFFSPVVDYRELNGRYYVFFCGEWHAPTSSLICSEELITSIEEIYYRNCAIFYFYKKDLEVYDNKCIRFSLERDKQTLLSHISNDTDFIRLI